MTKIYFASPLFAEGELAYNRYVRDLIIEKYPDVTVHLPQEVESINDKQAYADSIMIAQADTQAVLESDLMIAVLDGLVIDPGVASEIGIAFQAGIPIIGIYSDSRQQGGDHPQKLAALKEIAESQFSYINLYTVGLIKQRGEIVASAQEVLNVLDKYL